MAATSIEDAAPPITAAEFKASFYEALGFTGTTTTLWKSGGVTRTLIAIVCVCLAALSTLVSGLARSGFLGVATGLWKRLAAAH